MLKFRKLYPKTSPEVNFGPDARSGHRIVIDDSNIYSYGGYNPSPSSTITDPRDMAEFPLFRELWKFNLTSNIWNRLDMTGSVPKECVSYACILVNKKLFVIGGTGFPFAEVRSNVLYCFDLAILHWSVAPCKGTLPGKVYGHSLLHINGYIFLFGGTTGFFYNNEMYKLNLHSLTWQLISQPSSDGQTAPSPRYRQEMIAYGNLLYLFGGGTSETEESLKTVWIFDTEINKWHAVISKPDQINGFPAPRKCHACVHYDNDVYVSGGLGAGDNPALKDMWKFHIPTSQWIRLHLTLKNEIYFHAAAISESGTLYIFGGVIPSHLDSDDSTSIRSNALHKVDLYVKSLGEVCWEYIIDKFPQLLLLPHSDLIKLGIPRMYLTRLEKFGDVIPSQKIVAVAS